MAIFARYDGIDGDSQDANHDQWIEVLSMDWGAQTDEGEGSGGRRRANVFVDDVVLVFAFGKASPKLVEKCLKGEKISTLDVELTRFVGAGEQLTYLKYELEDVVITAFQTDASDDDEAEPPTMILSNAFGAIKMTYTEVDDTGSVIGKVETQYKNKKKK